MLASMRCFVASPGSNADMEIDVKSLLEKSYRSHAKEWNVLEKMEDQRDVLLKLTDSQYDVEKSQLILKTLSKEEIRGLKRSVKQVRDEARGLTPHNSKRSKAARKRMRRYQNSVLRRSETILASPWSVDKIRVVAREYLKVSDENRHGTSRSRETSQSSVTRHRGNIKRQRSKRNRARKVSAIKRKNPEVSAAEIYEELENEEVKSCKNFSVVSESMEESGDCEDSDFAVCRISRGSNGKFNARGIRR